MWTCVKRAQRKHRSSIDILSQVKSSVRYCYMKQILPDPNVHANTRYIDISL